MKLYHYSTNQLPVLLTKRAQGMSQQEIMESEKKSKELGLEAPYIDHISFFFDPLPSVLVAEVFKDVDHHVWYKGNVVYEHVVDVGVLEEGMLYRVVESIRKTAFMDKFITEHHWVDDDPVLLRKYLREIDRLQKQWGELGRSRAELLRQIQANQGVTAKAYKAARMREDWEYSHTRYASNVPHLMVYPESGSIAIEGVSRLKIGAEARTVVRQPTPASFRW